MINIINNFKTAGACWGVHLALTALLTMGLVAYDGGENTYGIMIAYMFLGWIIPFSLWGWFKKGLSRPVSSIRSNVDTYVVPVLFLLFGTLFFICGIFFGNIVDKITVNGETIVKSDPRFAEMNIKWRIGMICGGLFFAILGFFILQFIRRRKLKMKENVLKGVSPNN